MNAVDHDGHSALVYAVARLTPVSGYRSQQSITALLAAGADPALRDREGLTPADHAQRMLEKVDVEIAVIGELSVHREAALRHLSDQREIADEIAEQILSQLKRANHE